MDCFEADLLRQGLATATLQVRSHNPAKFLYWQLGYTTTSSEDENQFEMRKSVFTHDTR